MVPAIHRSGAGRCAGKRVQVQGQFNGSVLVAGGTNSVPIASVTSEKKTVDVKKYYNMDRLRPIYEFDGAPLFIMTSD